jgi:hypothetical protein
MLIDSPIKYLSQIMVRDVSTASIFYNKRFSNGIISMKKYE